MALVEIKGVSKEYGAEGKPLPIIEDITFTVSDNDFVCIVGPSGCGKSTLLRIIAGLEEPDRGEVVVRKATKPGGAMVSMVFQSFAIFPWLTVAQNIEVGMEALGVPEGERRERARRYVEAVGLDGFEDAYPRELSGGMKQRVGLARALAVDPVLLCMDEPFSALDPLTAENLREELLIIWKDPNIPPDAVVMVTHNIEEAVYMADRIIVLSNRPGRVLEDMEIDLPRPRDRKSQAFYEKIDKIYSLIA